MVCSPTIISIGATNFVKFMTSSPSQQRKALQDAKYPNPEGRAQAAYYRDARLAITQHVQGKETKFWLLKQAERVLKQSGSAGHRSRGRLEHNARALRDYARFFAERQLDYLSPCRTSLLLHGVRIRIVPELHVREKGIEKFMKLGFSSQEPDPRIPKIMTQLIFEAMTQAGYELKPSGAIYLDLSTGTEYSCSRSRSRVATEIEAACKNIAAMWESISPPSTNSLRRGA